MWQWISRFLGQSKAEKSAVDPAFIDRLVNFAGPRIRSVSDYRERLAPLVSSACRKTHRLGEKLPAPVALTPESWRQHPLLSLIFANPDRMVSITLASDEVREWFAARPLADQAFAVLAVTRATEPRYGMEEQDGLVRQDVLQQVLVFRDHRFGALVETAPALLGQTQRRAVEELAHHAARRISGLEAEKALVEDELNTLRIALRLGGATDSISAPPMQRQRLLRIEQLTRELVTIRTELEPEAQLAVLAAALRTPEQELRFNQTELWVDRLGVIRTEGALTCQVSLVEVEMMADEPVRRTLLPVMIPRSLIRSADVDPAQTTVFNAIVF